MTMPLSMMSELSSGGVCSSTFRTAVMIAWSGCSIASVISVLVRGIVRGRPAIMSRPLTSIRSGSSSGSAAPIWVLTSSAGRAPLKGGRCAQAGDPVPPLALHLQRLIERQRCADLDLDLLGRALADHEVVLAPDVVRDALVELVAADPQRIADDDATQCDDRDLA